MRYTHTAANISAGRQRVSQTGGQANNQPSSGAAGLTAYLKSVWFGLVWCCCCCCSRCCAQYPSAWMSARVCVSFVLFTIIFVILKLLLFIKTGINKQTNPIFGKAEYLFSNDEGKVLNIYLKLDFNAAKGTGS